MSGIDSFFQGILANFTNAVDGGLTAVENSLVLNLGQQLSLAPFYDLYLLNICRGNSSTTINKCSGYQDFLGTFRFVQLAYIFRPFIFTILLGVDCTYLGTRFNVTSSVVVGTTNISAPIASDLVSSVNGISQLFTGALKIAFAFYIISLVGSGSTIIGSLVGVFISPKMLVVANVSFTVLSSTFQFLASVVATVIINLSQKLIGEVGGALNIHSHKGGKVLLLTWLGWLFILLAGLYWFYIWFVEVRDFDVRIMRKESRGEKERFSKTNGMTTGNVTEMR